MDIIKRISIENFRSLRSLNVDLVRDYNSIVGLNSSGKSNVLRALNLFFNDSIDPSSLNLSMERDFSDYAPRRKKKLFLSALS
ncbi:AAA family ATPase [Amycolatopsis sp. NPDC051371]|uniref:AAA family ATPase n=1 Tax=Amycolatopsis sp. NPDC051371 TaxID=3155800 RepID=UPI00341A758F